MGEVKKVPSTSFLVNEKVTIEFIPKMSKDITDVRHIAYGGKLEGCYDYIAPPRLRKDKLKNILTAEEKEGLEYLMGIDLSVYGDFWKGYRKGGLFPIALGKSETVLDKSVPEQYIIWKVLLNNENLIANSKEEVRQKASYRYVMIAEGEKLNIEADKVNLKEEAYELLGKIKKSTSAMRYVLRQFGKHTHAKQDSSFLKGEIGTIIEIDTKRFVDVVNDKTIKGKILIQEALELGVIKINNDLYYTAEGKPLADKGQEPSLFNCATFLLSPLGQEVRFALEARIKNARD